MRHSSEHGVNCIAIVASLVLAACSGGAATPTGPVATRLSAKAIAVQPADFSGVSLHVCPPPATGTFQSYATAYRTDIKRRALILTANLEAAKADGWSQSLSGKVDTCKGALGFALDRSDGLGVMSYTFVFPTVDDAVVAFPTVGAGTFGAQLRGSQTGFGPNSASLTISPSYWIAWQHAAVIALVECDNVPSCKAGAQAVDHRIK